MRRQDILVLAGVSVVSAAAASAATWFFGVKKVTDNYEVRLDKEVRESVDFALGELRVRGLIVSDADPDDLASEMEKGDGGVEIEVVTRNEDISESEPLEEVDGERIFPDRGNMTLDELKAKNHVTRYDKILTEEEYKEPEPEEQVLRVGDTSWDPGNEDISVISRDIFLENTSEFDQATLTYFQDDGVVDEGSEFVPEHELLIGIGKPPFGQMSEDANIVYIRNKGIQTEYEVIQDPGNATDFLMHDLMHVFDSDKRP